jgi:rubrerythrin
LEVAGAGSRKGATVVGAMTLGTTLLKSLFDKEAKVHRCPVCSLVVPKGADRCPRCKTPLRWR